MSGQPGLRYERGVYRRLGHLQRACLPRLLSAVDYVLILVPRTACLPLPLHLAVVEDSTGVPAGQQGLGVSEIWPLSGLLLDGGTSNGSADWFAHKMRELSMRLPVAFIKMDVHDLERNHYISHGRRMPYCRQHKIHEFPSMNEGSKCHCLSLCPILAYYRAHAISYGICFTVLPSRLLPDSVALRLQGRRVLGAI